ncbi:hypothetical protein EI372_04755 [Vibrio fluvialis]|nr:hypothetical protein [Vibrio fluvialis]
MFLAYFFVFLLGSHSLTAFAHEGRNNLTEQIRLEDANQDVSALALDSAEFQQAQDLFRTVGGYGCTACHGLYAQGGGNVGGNIRDHSLSQINYALKNEPTMKLLNNALSDGDKYALAGYLKTLGKLELIEWMIDGEASYTQVIIDKESYNQMVIFNKTFDSIDLSLMPIGDSHTLSIEPYATESYTWKAKPGEYRLQYKHHVLDMSFRF